MLIVLAREVSELLRTYRFHDDSINESSLDYCRSDSNIVDRYSNRLALFEV